MSQLVILDVTEQLLEQLHQRAALHGRSAPAEAKAILEAALGADRALIWDGVDAIYDRLAASGHGFCDSAELIREDRER